MKELFKDCCGENYFFAIFQSCSKCLLWLSAISLFFIITANASFEYIEAKAREINSLNPSSRKRYFGLKKK